MWGETKTDPGPGDSRINRASPNPGRIRTGVIGAGFVSRFHLQTLATLPNVEVIGVADIRPERATAAARDHGIAASFDSHEKLLALRPDVVHVLTPARSHFELALAALEAGCHVFCEKPLACSAEHSRQLEEAAARADRRILVNHSLLGDRTVERGMRALAEGRIGEVHSLTIYRSSVPPARSYRLPYPEAGDPFREVGVHALYCARAILGRIDDVQAQVRTSGKHELVGYDEWSAQLRCERGFGQILLSWNAPEQHVISVQGTQGRLSMELWPGVMTLRPHGRRDRRAIAAMRPALDATSTIAQVGVAALGYLRGTTRWYSGIDRMIRKFYVALESGEPMPFDFDSVHDVVNWNERVARSVERS
ncbi:MAG: Gfo/Idh/MocA family oxidoreductase [Pseudomonadota bacterium]